MGTCSLHKSCTQEALLLLVSLPWESVSLSSGCSLTPQVLLLFHPFVAVPCVGRCLGLCRAMEKVWVACCRLLASCCTPNGGWNIAYPSTMSPSGSPTQTLPYCGP